MNEFEEHLYGLRIQAGGKIIFSCDSECRYFHCHFERIYTRFETAFTPRNLESIHVYVYVYSVLMTILTII